MGHDHEHDLRSYGRRRGRVPSPRQAALWRDSLPRFALDLSQPLPTRIGELFAPPVADVWLEIGFGGGEHLLWQARHSPGVGLIGCEPFQDGVVKVLSAIEEDQLTNIRLLADDARPLYHAGAAIASNYLVTLHAVASELFRAAGAPPEGLVPLMRRTIDNGFELTGPIERGDWETVDAHRCAIRAARNAPQDRYAGCSSTEKCSA